MTKTKTAPNTSSALTPSNELEKVKTVKFNKTANVEGMILEGSLIDEGEGKARSVRPMSAQHRGPSKFNGLSIE